MSEPKAEYGWMTVGINDFKDGDEHLSGGTWQRCLFYGSARCPFQRRRRIVAPDGWRVMGIDERILGQLQSTVDGINWKTYAGEFVDVPFSTKKITVGDWPGILAIATPIKPENITNDASKMPLPAVTISRLFEDAVIPKFHWGDQVSKVGGDYTFEGVVVSVFAKLSGRVRYVVEDDRGCLHVYSEKNLEAYGK